MNHTVARDSQQGFFNRHEIRHIDNLEYGSLWELDAFRQGHDIDRGHAVSAIEEVLSGVGADEAACAGDKDVHDVWGCG